MFLIFNNDLDEDINSNILKFADDTQIFNEVRNSTDCIQLQADLDKLVLWAQKWQIKFNVDKCKVLHEGNLDNSSSYYTEGSELTEVSYEKDLGCLPVSPNPISQNPVLPNPNSPNPVSPNAV